MVDLLLVLLVRLLRPLLAAAAAARARAADAEAVACLAIPALGLAAAAAGAEGEAAPLERTLAGVFARAARIALARGAALPLKSPLGPSLPEGPLGPSSLRAL